MSQKFKAIILLSFFILAQSATCPADQSVTPIGENVYTVWRVDNADMLRLKEDKKVILAGIDSPEYFLNRKQYRDASRTKIELKKMHWAGKKAHQFIKTLVQGKKVTIKMADPARDSRKRLVGYVFLADGTFVNGEMVKAGFARVVDRPGQSEHHKELLKLQAEARENNRGLWGYGIFQKFE